MMQVKSFRGPAATRARRAVHDYLYKKGKPCKPFEIARALGYTTAQVVGLLDNEWFLRVDAGRWRIRYAKEREHA